jgi:hypothetical protein
VFGRVQLIYEHQVQTVLKNQKFENNSQKLQ